MKIPKILVLAALLWLASVTAVLAANEQAQISSICPGTGGMVFHVTVQTTQPLTGTTGILTGTTSTGTQFTVSLTFDTKAQGSFFGTKNLPPPGPYTITQGIVGIGPGVTPIAIHNLPLKFFVPQGYGSCVTAVTLTDFSAKSSTSLSSKWEDHIFLPMLFVLFAVAILVYILVWIKGWAQSNLPKK